jgi:hypothetical protein
LVNTNHLCNHKQIDMCPVELTHMSEPCFFHPLHFLLLHHYMQLMKLIISRSFGSINFSNSFICWHFEV